MATERKVGPRGLLQRANNPKVSVMGFIKAFRDILVDGELGYVTAPIVWEVETGTLYLTPAIEKLRNAIMGHIMIMDALKVKDQEEETEAKAEKAEVSPKVKRPAKPFTACIRDGSGAIVETLDGKAMKASFDLPQRASDWVDRRLFESTPDCFGEVVHNRAHNPEKATDYISRDESMSRILKRPMGAVCKGQSKGGGGLSFGVKSKPSKSTFSHG